MSVADLDPKLVGWNIDIRSEEEIKREVTEQMGALIASGESVPLSAIEGVTGQQADALADQSRYGEIPDGPRGSGIQTIDGFKTRTPFQSQLDLQAALGIVALLIGSLLDRSFNAPSAAAGFVEQVLPPFAGIPLPAVWSLSFFSSSLRKRRFSRTSTSPSFSAFTRRS